MVFSVGVDFSRFRFFGLVWRMLWVKMGSRVVVLLSSMVNRFSEMVFSMIGCC